MSEVHTGGCLCGAIRYECTYRLGKVVVCHCSDCRKAHAGPAGYNARVSKSHLTVTQGEPRTYEVTAASGLKLTRQFCGDCGSQLFSERANMPDYLSLKVGTLDDPSECPPDVQIFTSSKQPWVPLNPDIPSYEDFYSIPDVWPKDRLDRWNALFG